MRRNRILMTMLAALLVWWAVRVVPAALAFATATVNVEGSLRVAGAATGVPFVTCTAVQSFPAEIATWGWPPSSVVVTCYNNLNVSLPVTLILGTLTPPPGTQPTNSSLPLVSWSNQAIVKTTTITVPATGAKSATARLYVYALGNAWSGPYRQAYTSAANIGTGFDYFKNHTVTFTVQQ